MSAVEDARAAYAARALVAPPVPCYRLLRYGCCRPCGRPHLAVDAASLDLDIAMAAECRPYAGPSAKLLNAPPGLCSCAPKCDQAASHWDGWGRGYVWCDDHSWSFDPPIRAALEATS